MHHLFKHYINISIRNILSDKPKTAINVVSLVLGVTIMLVISLYAFNELSVDKFHEKNERIYKVSYGNSSLTPGLLNQFLKNQFPEIEQTTQLQSNKLNQFSPVLSYKSNSFEIEKYYTADSHFFDIFDFEVVQGNIHTALESPFSIILTETEAARIFSKPNPIGETLTWKGMQDFTFTVGAIVKDLPSNSSIQFNGLVSDASIIAMGERFPEDWGYTVYESYLLLKPNVDEKLLEQKLRTSLMAHYNNNLTSNASAKDAELNPITLHSLSTVYFDKSLTNDTTNRGNLMLVKILLLIGGIVMFLSLINYVNLTTAKAASRTKEICIQKLVGSSRKNLIFQNLTETTIVSFFTVVVGALISLAIVEKYGYLINITNELVLKPSMFLLLIPIILLMGFIAGIYPALLFSSKNVIEIVTFRSGSNTEGINLRSTLVIFQFSITIVLIVATLLIFKQVNYIKDKDLGIPTDEIVYAKLPFQILAGNKETLRERLQTIPEIDRIAFSSNIFVGIEGLGSQEIDGKTINFATTWVDAEFISLYNLQLVDGRFFSKDLETDVNATALINEAAVREFDMADPFQLTIRIPGGKAKVVGIVKDFNFKSLHNRIEPLAIVYLPRQGQFVNFRIEGNKFPETLAKIDSIWAELAPGFPFKYQFLDQGFDKLYNKDVQIARAISVLCIIAILISVFGLLSLSSFLAAKRTKEIGIRKVNGATISEILIMLNKDFIKWLVIAFVIATPIAYFAMNKWLESFAYKTSLNWWIFAFAGLLTLVIALITVSWQTVKAARRNPVEALRYE